MVKARWCGVDLDELAEHWTLLDDERELVAGKRGPTRLGFALLLKFYARAGRFPRGRAELDDQAVAFVAHQVGVPASDLGFYEWTGSTIEYHRSQVRRHLGFRECSAEDAGKLTEWLAGNVCQAERRTDRVREELLARCRTERIEPPPHPVGPDCRPVRPDDQVRDRHPDRYRLHRGHLAPVYQGQRRPPRLPGDGRGRPRAADHLPGPLPARP
jgi:hypothetical protein